MIRASWLRKRRASGPGFSPASHPGFHAFSGWVSCRPSEGSKGRNKLKRSIQSIAVLLTVPLLLTMSGCRLGRLFPSPAAKNSTPSGVSSAVSATAQTASASKDAFSLPVALGKNLNPLTTDSMINLTLWPLMFDSLAEPDAGYTPEMALASSVDNSGTTVTVHLRGGVRFTDGTSLTAKDVLYSYNEARNNAASFFHANTANIASVAASGSDTVIFTLNAPDMLFANLLTIPIIKSGSDNVSVPTGGTPAPIGSGRYSFSDNSLNGSLTVHKEWYKGTLPAIQTIHLVNMLDSSALLTSLKTGVIDYLYADANGGNVATAGLSTAAVSLNQMVFLGVNWSNASLANAHIRRAVSLAIDRDAVVSDAYSSRAKVSSLPFNPEWSALKQLTASSTSESKAASAASSFAASSEKTASSAKSAASESKAEAAGSANRSEAANELTAGGIPAKAGDSATVLTFRLLVNSDNAQMMAAAKRLTSSLASSGIAIVTDAEPAASYAAKLTAGQFDLYLGEIRLTDDMDIRPFFRGGTAGYGAPAQSSTQAAFSGWRAGSTTLASLVDTFQTETPFIPLCCRTGTVAYSPALKGTVAPTSSDIFRSAETWHFGG